MLAKILEVFPMTERKYNDKEGREMMFASKGFIMMTCHGAFYAEAVQEWAAHWEKQKIAKGTTVDASVSFRCRDYTDKEGNKRYSNEIVVANMIIIK